MKINLNFLNALWPVVLTAGGATAQPYQVQQGNVLDANSRLGSANLNTGGRTYDFNAGNRIVTGNVTGGASFRGMSTIRDSSSFGLVGPVQNYLPSERLLNFRRDSYSVGDLQSGRSVATAPLPYYSPQSTVTSSGSISPGPPQVRSPYAVPRENLRLDSKTLPQEPVTAGGSLLKVPTMIARIDNGQPVTGQVNQRLLSSPLFGSVRTIPADVLAAQAEKAAAMGANVGAPLDTRVNKMEPMDTRLKPAADGTAGTGGSPLDRLLGPEGSQRDRSGAGPADRRTGGDQNAARGNTGGLPPAGQSDTRVEPMTAQSGSDVYLRMRATAGQLRQPLQQLPKIGEVRTDTPESPGLARPINPVTPERGVAQAPPPAGTRDQIDVAVNPELTAEPIRTFVGTSESAVNKYLAQAEKQLKAGQYYRAAAEYDLARTIDPRNPLPLLGKSTALLAAGDYMSSANGLFQAIQLFESLAEFRVELSAFVPDVSALDRRRADLERRLETYEDYRLRFLLGFAEYNSNLEKLGLANMRKAADAAPAEMTALRRFVQRLEQRAGAARPIEVK